MVSRGPYAILRHPGYAGAIPYNLAGPILLGSFPVLGAGTGMALLPVTRTGLEDMTLRQELKGYPAYVQRVCAKLILFIW